MNKNNLKIFFLTMLLVSASFSFEISNYKAENTALPARGPHIEMPAGNCDIGPFGREGDVGVYEGLCSQLTSAEKCLAYLKQHVGEAGQVYKTHDSAKTTFCLKSVLGKMAD